MSSAHQVILAVIHRFFESNFKKSIVLSYDRKRDTRARVSFFRVSFSETPMAKIENRERKPRRRGLHVARGDFSCSASQNHRAFICCTSFPNRACSVGLRSADCRCQPGYCTAACMKNCAPDGALPGRAHISAATRQFLRYLDRRNAPEAPAGCTGFDNQA